MIKVNLRYIDIFVRLCLKQLLEKHTEVNLSFSYKRDKNASKRVRKGTKERLHLKIKKLFITLNF